jgi:hypothetical protein
MLRKVLAVYHPTMVAADTADDKCEAIIAIETRFARSRLAHKAPVLYRNRGEL